MKLNNVECLILASIISADNEHLDEDVKQDIMQRYHEWGEDIPNWSYILEPIKDEIQRDKLIELLERDE